MARSRKLQRLQQQKDQVSLGTGVAAGGRDCKAHDGLLGLVHAITRSAFYFHRWTRRSKLGGLYVLNVYSSLYADHTRNKNEN